MPRTFAPNRPLSIVLVGIAIAVVFVQARMATVKLVGQGYATFGRAAQRAGDLPSARMFFERSTGWYPHDWELQYQRSGLLQGLGELDEASAAFEKSLALAPHEMLTLTNYARLLASQGELVRAAELNDHALNIAPAAWRAHEVAGFIASAQGDYAGAAQEFEQALDLSKTPDQRVMNQLANALYQTGDYKRALTYAEMAIKKQGLQVNHHLVRGKVLLALDRPKEAVQPLARAAQGYGRRVQKDATKLPALIESRRYLAMAQIEAGQLNKAAATLENLTLAVGSTPYTESLLDDFSAALTGTLHALNATTQFHFGRALFSVERYEEAAQAFLRAFPKLDGGDRLDCGARYAHASVMAGRPDDSLTSLGELTPAERAAIESRTRVLANQ